MKLGGRVVHRHLKNVSHQQRQALNYADVCVADVRQEVHEARHSQPVSETYTKC